jgi:putative ABC transport system permease protein
MLRTRQREATVEEPADGDVGMSAGAAYSSPPAMPSAAAGPISVPAYAPTGGLVASLLICGVAGLYPAVRAARLSPTEALRTV